PSASPTPTGAPAGTRPALPAPALVGPTGPADAPQPVLKDVVLAWAPVAGATGYTVQVSQDGDFSDDAVTYEGQSVSTRLALPALPSAAYRWRVAATQAAGHGFWSTSGAFTEGWRDRVSGLRTSAGPAGDEFPTFAWTPIASASEYELQVSSTPTFDHDPTQTQAGFGTTACFTVRTRVTGANEQGEAKNDGAGDCDFTNLAPGAQRYWRVRALDHLVDDAGEVDTTPVVRDGVTYQPLAPKSGELDTGTCPQPGGATASASPSVGPTPSASPSAAADASFSCDAAHTVQRSAWSDVQTVTWTPTAAASPTAATYAPVAVKPLAPEACTARPAVPGEGALADCTDFPTLDWDARDGATGYRLYIALDDAFTNVQQIVETPATEWTPTAAWRDTTASQTYYYAVQACTAVRCGAVTSTPDSLRKKNPRTELTAPAAGAAFGPTDVQLRWKPFSTTQRAALGARVAGTPATGEAYAYRVQVADAPADGRPATDADFQAPVEDVTVDGALCRPGPVDPAATVDPRTTTRAVQSCTGAGLVAHDPARDEVTYTSATTSYPTGSYVWRVQALDASGHKLPWSKVGSFVRDVTPPTATVTGTKAADGRVVVRFSEPVTGVSPSTVRLSPATASTLAVSADGRSATVSPARTWVPGQTYVLSLGAGIADAVGNPLAPVSASSRIAGLVDDGSAALSYVGSWGFRSSSNAVGGGFRTSTPTMRAQTAATVTLAGKGVLLTGCAGPSGGLLDLYVDGTKRARVDTYRAYSGCGVRLARIALADGQHRVQVRGVGLKRAASRSTSVQLDAVTAL
ncbi:MAG: sdrD 1, partial [Frankiales bacterium]|nr:sdrD 1 [Frankiales bacterium]